MTSRFSFLYGFSPSIMLHVFFFMLFFLGGLSEVKKMKNRVEDMPVIQVDLSRVKIEKVSMLPDMEETKREKTEAPVEKKSEPVKKQEEPKLEQKKEKVVPKEPIKPVEKKPDVARPKVSQKIENGDHHQETVKTTTELHDMSLSAKDALRVRIRQCWNIDPTRPYPPNLTFQITAYLTQDGNVFRTQAHTVANDSLMAYLNSSAIRAIQMCAPYDFLPVDQYEQWKEIEITFDPASKQIK
ncbi:MAG: hypothetical protein JXR30_03125 [Alphaproteobacteria bacterium]|nr:hypothetical protein [Alphaproteobacteria bacterium]